MTSNEVELKELERAVALLGRNTRPGRLLEYLGAKYFQHQLDQLTEFNIATHVFGRSEKTFDSTEDAVVRVEVHRLRKKLKDLYEKDDRTEGVQISLPAGTYVPQFTAIHHPQAAPISPGDAGVHEAAGRHRAARWPWGLAVVGVIALAVIGLIFKDALKSVPSAAQPPSPAEGEATPPPVAGAQTEVHILAGHSGSEVIDNSGVRWTSDRYFVAGGHWTRDSRFLRGTSRPFLFAKYRTGEFGYDIPMAPGSYELRLFLASPARVGEEKLSGFGIALNAKPLLESYDVIMSANGADVADEQVFRDVSPNEDGYVRLWFSNLLGSPLLNALELTPGTPGKLQPIRITMQPTSYIDHLGQRWRADDYYINGFRNTERGKVSGTEDPELFSAERFGHFSYAIPVDRRGRYTVVLHFAEFYYGPNLPGGGGTGSRVFHVYCNGQTLLRNFDVYKEAGSLRLVTRRFANIEPSAQGKINLTFEPVINNATISGIEILDEGS